MVRGVFFLFGCFVALLLVRVPAAGQVAVEAGIGSATSATGAAGSRSVGTSIGGIMSNLDRILRPAGSAASKTDSAAPASKTAARRRPAANTTAVIEKDTPAVIPPPPSFEDAAQIEKGIGYEELLRRFGPPAIKIATGSDAQTMSYASNGSVVQVEVQGGTVISVAKVKSGA